MSIEKTLHKVEKDAASGDYGKARDRGDIESIRNTYTGRTLLTLSKQVKDQFGYEIDFQKRGAERYHWTPPKTS